MSSVEKLVGREVESVLREQGYRFLGTEGVWMSVGQVAEAVEISKPTARKYLNLLVAAGLAVRTYQHSPLDTVRYRMIVE